MAEPASEWVALDASARVDSPVVWDQICQIQESTALMSEAVFTNMITGWAVSWRQIRWEFLLTRVGP